MAAKNLLLVAAKGRAALLISAIQHTFRRDRLTYITRASREQASVLVRIPYLLYVQVSCYVGSSLVILVCNYFAAICTDNDAMIRKCVARPSVGEFDCAVRIDSIGTANAGGTISGIGNPIRDVGGLAGAKAFISVKVH